MRLFGYTVLFDFKSSQEMLNHYQFVEMFL